MRRDARRESAPAPPAAGRLAGPLLVHCAAPRRPALRRRLALRGRREPPPAVAPAARHGPSCRILVTGIGFTIWMGSPCGLTSFVLSICPIAVFTLMVSPLLIE